MKDFLSAALQRSPWLLLAALVTGLVALSIITSRSYGLSVMSGSTRVNLTPPPAVSTTPDPK